MFVPIPPAIKKIDRISPTFYEAALKCTSRAAWLAGGDRKLLPAHPRALLGISVHAVLAEARVGRITSSTDSERLIRAERLFDDKARELFAAAHPLVRAKFDGPERLPFYNLFRARAAKMASDIASKRVSGPSASSSQEPESVRAALESGRGPAAEAALVSKDGRIAGRADVLDAENATVIDYKTGAAGDSGPITDAELRQLQLYAYLAHENGISIARGVIERADRTRAEVQIRPEQAADEGRRALVVLDSYNQHAGKPFESGTSPSPEACRLCPCIPFCDAFWRSANAEWSNKCGTQVEGVIESMEGGALVSINLTVTRGSCAKGSAVVTRLSRECLTFPGATLPQPQQTVRVTDATYVEESSSPAVFRADRIATAVWTVRSEAQ